MFSEAILGSLNEGAGFVGGMDPAIAAITLEGANDIGNIELNEFAVQSLYEFKMNLQMIDTAAICEEYQYLKTNGIEMVAEGALDSIKSWFKRVKETIVKFGQKVAEFFKKLMVRIKSRMNSEKKWLDSHDDALSELGSSVKLRKSIKCNAAFVEAIGESMPKAANKLYSVLSNKVSSVTVAAAGSSIESKSKKEVKDSRGSYEKKYLGELAQALGFTSDDNTVEKIKEKINDDKKDTLLVDTVPVNKCKKALETVSDDKKSIDTSFNSAKTAISNALTVVKQMERECEHDTARYQNARNAVPAINSTLSILTAANNYMAWVLDGRRRLCKSLLTAAIKQHNGDELEREIADESASILDSIELFG